VIVPYLRGYEHALPFKARSGMASSQCRPRHPPSDDASRSTRRSSPASIGAADHRRHGGAVAGALQGIVAVSGYLITTLAARNPLPPEAESDGGTSITSPRIGPAGLQPVPARFRQADPGRSLAEMALNDATYDRTAAASRTPITSTSSCTTTAGAGPGQRASPNMTAGREAVQSPVHHRAATRSVATSTAVQGPARRTRRFLGQAFTPILDGIGHNGSQEARKRSPRPSSTLAVNQMSLLPALHAAMAPLPVEGKLPSLAGATGWLTPAAGRAGLRGRSSWSMSGPTPAQLARTLPCPRLGRQVPGQGLV